MDEIAEFCKLECWLQGCPNQWLGMVQAWAYMAKSQELSVALEAGHLQHCAHLIEPEKNKFSEWRKCNVRVGNNLKSPMSAVTYLMDGYLQWLVEKPDPGEAFYLFEEIHPFKDGNGRVGQIIYNYLNGTMYAPEMAPNFYLESRRDLLVGRGWVEHGTPEAMKKARRDQMMQLLAGYHDGVT